MTGVLADWKEVRLDDHCEANWGNTTITKSSYVDSGVTAFSASGPDGFVSWHEHDGEGIVLSAIGALCGKTWLAHGKWTPIKNTIWIKSKSISCSTGYLYHATSNPDVWPSRGAAQPFIALGDVRDLEFLLPPLKEQEAIAEALSDADEAIESLDSLITKKRDVKQAAMQQLLTGLTRLPGFTADWKEVRLGDLGSFSKGAGIKKDDVVSAGVPCVRYGQLYTEHDSVIRSVRSFVSTKVASTSRPLVVGEILFAGSGETKAEIGKCVAYVDGIGAVAGGDLVILTPKQCSSIFLGYALNSPEVVRQKMARAQGDAVVHISAASLATVVVGLPSLKEQEAIAESLSAMDDELEALNEQILKLRMLKEGMMQDLLTGKVRLV